MSASSHSPSAPLRKVAAFHDLPSLAVPGRKLNPASYLGQRPPPGKRTPNESPLPLTSSADTSIPSLRGIRDSIEHWLSGITISDGDYLEMYRFSEKLTSESSSEGNSRAWISLARRGSWTLTPKKLILMFGAFLGIWLWNSLTFRTNHLGVIFPIWISCPVVECADDLVASSSSVPHGQNTLQHDFRAECSFSTS